MSKIEDAFEEFNSANPDIYRLFCEFAEQAFARGIRTLSSKLLMERIRWETTVVTSGDGFKVNNNFTAHYARRYMADFPGRLQFETRKVRS